MSSAKIKKSMRNLMSFAVLRSFSFHFCLRCRKIRLKWRNRIETRFDGTRSRTECTASGEVHSFEPIFQAIIQGAEKGHRICKLNRRVTRRRTSVRREVKFADSKRHFQSKFVPTNFHLKQKDMEIKSMPFAVCVLFQAVLYAE